MFTAPPKNLSTLQQRASELHGKTIADLARAMNIALPADLKTHKGFMGELIEQALGADAGCESRPDFSFLGIELKTLPVNAAGLPQESTYVCTVPLTDLVGLRWEDSAAYQKLKHVLWVPIEVDKTQHWHERRLLAPILWQANPDQAEILAQDFEELMELIALGQLEQITASIGTYLHIRPKAAHGQVLTQGLNESGELTPTLPRGFYLRSTLTKEILMQGNVAF